MGGFLVTQAVFQLQGGSKVTRGLQIFCTYQVRGLSASHVSPQNSPIFNRNPRPKTDQKTPRRGVGGWFKRGLGG